MNKLMKRMTALTIMLASSAAFAEGGCDIFNNCTVPEPDSLPLVLLGLLAAVVARTIVKSRRK